MPVRHSSAPGWASFFFGGLGSISGSLRGRVSWSIWWTWDARLTTTLILWLTYVSYLMLRRFSSGSSVTCCTLSVADAQVLTVRLSMAAMASQGSPHEGCCCLVY
ncbi:MAG TPA: cytochrome c biogenesis protein CcsA [Terracidiphilus sp.]